MFQKTIRISNPALLQEVREMPCVVCARFGCDPHHVKSRASIGHDVPQNLMSLCRECHTLMHKIGLTQMAEKYSQVKQWLLENGWTLNKTINKWRN